MGQEILRISRKASLQSRGAAAKESHGPAGAAPVALTKADYVALAEFRFLLRNFMAFSEYEARGGGWTPRQHQALLQIKGWPAGETVSIGELASRMLVRPHSAVELADRLEEAGLIERIADRADRRRVLLRLTAKAEVELLKLSEAHCQELQRLRPALLDLLKNFPAPAPGIAEPGTREGESLRAVAGG